MTIKRPTSNELIGLLMDRPELFAIKTNGRRGTVWSLNNLRLLDPAVCTRLIERGRLIERDPPVVPVGKDAAQSFRLARVDA